MAVLGFPKTLTWNDFGKPIATPPPTYSGTHTACHIEIDINYSWGGTVQPKPPDGDHELKDVKVEVKVNTLETWVVNGIPTAKNQADILKHEQGHFNICGITARDVEKALLKLRHADSAILVADAALVADGIISNGVAKEDKYDDDPANGGTDNGNDATQQATWNSKIAAAKSLGDLP